MNKQDAILPFSLGCMLYGIWVSFCEIFQCRVAWGSYLLPAFIIAALTVFLLMSWRLKATLGILGIGTGVFALYALKNIERLTKEADGLLFYVDQCSVEYYGNVIFHAQRKCSMEHTLLWILAGIFFAIFITLFAFRLRNFPYGFFPCYLVVGAGMMLGRTPGIRGVLFLLTGFILALFWLNGQDRGGRAKFYMVKTKKKGRGSLRYLLFFILLAAVLPSAVYFMDRTQRQILSHDRDVQKMQYNLEKKIAETATDISRLISGTLSIDNNGRLQNSEPKYADRPVLEVTLWWKPNADIYLKGFVGSNYQNGRWTKEDVERFNVRFPDKGTRELLASLGVSYMESWSDFGDTGDDDIQLAIAQGIKQRMKVEHVGSGKWSSYTYVPYFADIGDITDADSDVLLSNKDEEFLEGDACRTKVSSEYMINFMPVDDSVQWDTYKFYANNMSEYSYLYSSIDLGEGTDCLYYDYSEVRGHPLRGTDSDFREYLNTIKRKTSVFQDFEFENDILSEYLDYAWKEYGYKNESHFLENDQFLKKLRRANQNYSAEDYTSGMNVMDRVVFVRKLLKKEAQYSKILNRLPSGKDYAEYFLLEQKKGFCEHFATAGTLLMRELGIPSRYAGGFRIPAERFKKNEDGTFTAEVLDSDAHAWTEVLTGMLGWFPADMTPPSDSSEQGNKTSSGASENPATPTPGKKEKVTDEPAITAKPTPTAKPTASFGTVQNAGTKNRKKPFMKLPVMGKTAVIIVFVLLAAGLWILCCRIYYAGRKRKLLRARAKSRSLSVRIGLHDLLCYMKGCGLAVSGKMPEKTWMEELRRFCREMPLSEEHFDEEQQEELLRIVRKAAFSAEEVTVEEYRAFRRFSGSLVRIGQKKAGKMRIVYLKLTGRYGKI